MIHTCAYCGCEFNRHGKARGKLAFCKPAHWHAFKGGIVPREASSVTVDELRTHAMRGESMRAIAENLGVGLTTCKRLMHQSGVYDVWKEQRAI